MSGDFLCQLGLTIALVGVAILFIGLAINLY